MMLEKVRRYINEENLFAPDAKIVVGLSGGMDSMALIDILIQLGYSCIAAHCNFHLRGDESNRDASFVESWCSSNNIPFVTTNFYTVKYAAQNKISIEMAARDLRYGWFEEIRQQYQADAIAVAHHKDDSVETVLMNLIRGTGIKGLTGIPPKNGFVSRPLLTSSRNEIEEYIYQNEIPFVTDSTNKEDIYVRNMFRIRVMPILEEINPSVREAIYRSSQNLVEVEKLYSESVGKSIKAVYNEGVINIEELKKCISLQSVLFEILTPLGFTPSTVADILSGIDGESGRVYYSDNYRVIKDRDSYLVDMITQNNNEQDTFFIEKEDKIISNPIKLSIRKERLPIEIQKDSAVLYADADKLLFPLVIRKWRQGDWFIPFGMDGRKKLSDFFTDKKYSIKDKEDAWIIASGDDVVWVVGERSDNRFRVKESTQNIIIIEYVK